MKARANPTPTRIRQLREDRGIIREQLAVKAGVSSSTLYLAERAGLLSDETAAKIAKVLGVTIEELRQ
jgi:DNA-binding XRE family transcriptional regulator